MRGAGTSAGQNDPRKYRTWIRKCEAETEAEDEEIKAASAPGAGEDAPSVSPSLEVARAPVSSAPAHLRIKFQYYQSYEKVTVAVLEKGLKESEVDVEVGARRLTVRRKGDGGALLFDKVLYEEVVPEKRRARFMASKVCVGGGSERGSRPLRLGGVRPDAGAPCRGGFSSGIIGLV